MSFDILNEAFKRLSLLEDTFDTSLDGIRNLANFMDEDDLSDTVDVIDTEATTEEELSDSYVGKVIVNCNVCHSHIFRNPDEIEINEDGVVNIEDECPYCGEKEGFVVVGKIEDFDEEELLDDEESEEDTPTEHEDENNNSEEVNESKKSSIDRSKLKKLHEDVEQNPLKGLRSNVIEFPNGECVYIEYKDGKIYAGGATNNGIIHEYEIDYDNDASVDQNIQNLYDIIVEEKPEFLKEAIKNSDATRGKVIKNLDNGGNEDTIRDLTLCIENDGDVYRNYTTPVIQNLRKKYAKGTFDEELAVQAFYNVVVNALKVPHFTRYSNYTIKNVSVSERYAVAKNLLSGAMDEITYENKVNEAADVTDQVTINTNEDGFITKKKDLEKQGYKVIGTGNGQIIMAKPKVIKEGLSYGELTAIESEWNKFKKSKGISGKAESDVAWEFIDTECVGVYDTEEERNEVFGVIGGLEENLVLEDKEELNEAPYLEPRYDARQSFYNKAFVTDDDNDLYSYGLKVMTIKDGQPVITCPVDRISQTTLRHIKEFLLQNGFKAINKAQILRDYKQEVPTRDIKIDECNKPMNEDVRDSHYRDYIYDYFQYTTDDEFLNLIAELLDRVEDFSNEQEVWEAVDSGMIYTKDQWTAYMHYCDIGDPAENMWESLMGDMIALCSKIADNTHSSEDDEELDEAFNVKDTDGTFSIVQFSKSIYDNLVKNGVKCDVALDGGYKIKVTCDNFDGVDEIVANTKALVDNNLEPDVEDHKTYRYYKLKKKGVSVAESLKEFFMNKWKNRINEGINNATVETDDSKLTMTADENGKVTVTTEPIESATASEGESITPLDDSEMDALIDNSADIEEEPVEEPVEAEEIDFDIEEIDEESLDDLGESYMRRIYENVDSFKTSSVHADTSKIIVEGTIKFKSGKEKKTGFIFEAHNATRDGKVKFLGENKHFSHRRNAFTLNGVVRDKKLIAESLSYNYSIGNKEVVKGSVKRSK